MSTNDPLEVTYDRNQFESNLFGKVEIVGKRMHKPQGEKMREFQSGDPGKGFIRLEFTLTTIDAMGLTRPVIEKNTLSFTDDWNDTIWPSLEACGCVIPRDINGKYVEVEMVSNGRKYTNKEGKEREETVMKFLRAFPNEAACITAYENEAGVTPAEDDKRAAEWRPKIEVYVEVTNGDLAALEARLTKSGSPFGIDSALVQDVLKSAAVPA